MRNSTSARTASERSEEEGAACLEGQKKGNRTREEKGKKDYIKRGPKESDFRRPRLSHRNADRAGEGGQVKKADLGSGPEGQT